MCKKFLKEKTYKSTCLNKKSLSSKIKVLQTDYSINLKIPRVPFRHIKDLKEIN